MAVLWSVCMNEGVNAHHKKTKPQALQVSIGACSVHSSPCSWATGTFLSFLLQ